MIYYNHKRKRKGDKKMDYKTCETCIGRKCPYNAECVAKRDAEVKRELENLKRDFWKHIIEERS